MYPEQGLLHRHRIHRGVAPPGAADHRHKVSGKKGHAYWARWTYRKSGGGTKTSGWKKSSRTGDNGRAPGVAVETLWGHSGRAGGPKLTKGTVCTQFKGSKQKACFRLN